jgi:hypothetical protein
MHDGVGDNISLSKQIAERSRKRPIFEAGNYIALVTENLNLMLLVVPKYPDNKWLHDTGEVTRGMWERQSEKCNVQMLNNICLLWAST